MTCFQVLFVSERKVIGVGFDCNPMVFAADERGIWYVQIQIFLFPKIVLINVTWPICVQSFYFLVELELLRLFISK